MFLAQTFSAQCPGIFPPFSELMGDKSAQKCLLATAALNLLQLFNLLTSKDFCLSQYSSLLACCIIWNKPASKYRTENDWWLNFWSFVRYYVKGDLNPNILWLSVWQQVLPTLKLLGLRITKALHIAGLRVASTSWIVIDLRVVPQVPSVQVPLCWALSSFTERDRLENSKFKALSALQFPLLPSKLFTNISYTTTKALSGQFGWRADNR